MDFGGGVEGGLIVLGSLGDEGVDREGLVGGSTSSVGPAAS